MFYFNGARMFRTAIFRIFTLATLTVAGSVGAAPRVNPAGSLEIAPDQSAGEITLFVFEDNATPPPLRADSDTPEPLAQTAGAKSSGRNSTRSESVPKARHLMLGTGPLVSDLGGTPLRGTLAIDPSELDVEPDGMHPVTVRASNIFFEGSAQADLLNYGEKVGSLRVHRAPFAVGLIEQAVTLREGGTGILTLRNDTQYPLELRWRLQLGHIQLCGPAIQVRPTTLDADLSNKKSAANKGGSSTN